MYLRPIVRAVRRHPGTEKSTYPGCSTHHPVDEDGQGFAERTQGESRKAVVARTVPYSQTDQFAVPLDKEMDARSGT